MTALHEIIERLYNLNAEISIRFVAGIQKPKTKDLEQINSALGEIIKELRRIE